MWAKYVAPEASTMDRASRHDSLPPGTMALDSRETSEELAAPRRRALLCADVSQSRLAAGDRPREERDTRRPYFFNPLPDFGTLIANLYVSEEIIFYAAPLSMTGHSRSSSGGTHGHQESWDRRLENFIEESGWTAEQLLPTVFKPFLWNPALLAGCFEDVKRRLFPDDERAFHRLG